jgi:sigma-E factor negative regulatory protein RseB
MLFLRAAALACVGATLTLLSMAAGSAHAGAVEDRAEARDVRGWLMRIHEAAGHRNFQGTFVVSGAGAVSSAHIAHYCVAENQFERIETLDGQARQVFRHNDRVHTVWPGHRVAMVEQSRTMLSFPALLQSGDDHIPDFYDLHRQGAGRVAGHEADLLLLQPRDAHRYGYRLWAEKSTGLLLRADVLGERGEVLETSAFSEVTIGVRPLPDSVLVPMKRLEGYRVVQAALMPTRLETEGWQMRQAVPGFRQVSCVKRPLDAAMPTDGSGAVAEPVLQIIYSDGLTHVSLFIERFDVQRHARAVVTAVGATQTLTQRSGDWWITAVGDVPPATLRLFTASLDRIR